MQLVALNRVLASASTVARKVTGLESAPVVILVTRINVIVVATPVILSVNARNVHLFAVRVPLVVLEVVSVVVTTTPNLRNWAILLRVDLTVIAATAMMTALVTAVEKKTDDHRLVDRLDDGPTRKNVENLQNNSVVSTAPRTVVLPFFAQSAFM